MASEAREAKKRRGLPDELLERGEVEALLAACSRQSATGIRNRALITVLYRGGLRLGEALCLQPKDVDPRAGRLLVVNPQNERRRRVVLDPMAFDVLARWLDHRRALGLNGRAPVFSTLSGQPLKQAYVRALLPRLGRQAGIRKRVHAHALRHTHAREMALHRLPVEEIQRQLGHASRATTVRYLASARREGGPTRSWTAGTESTRPQAEGRWELLRNASQPAEI